MRRGSRSGVVVIESDLKIESGVTVRSRGSKFAVSGAPENEHRLANIIAMMTAVRIIRMMVPRRSDEVSLDIISKEIRDEYYGDKDGA